MWENKLVPFTSVTCSLHYRPYGGSKLGHGKVTNTSMWQVVRQCGANERDNAEPSGGEVNRVTTCCTHVSLKAWQKGDWCGFSQGPAVPPRPLYTLKHSSGQVHPSYDVLVDFKQLRFLNVSKCARIPQTPNMTERAPRHSMHVCSVCLQITVRTSWMAEDYYVNEEWRLFIRISHKLTNHLLTLTLY